MVDYSRYYFRNFNEKRRDVGVVPIVRSRSRRGRGRVVRLGVLMTLVSFAVTLVSINSLSGGALLASVVGSREETRQFYAVATFGFESVEIAGNYAVSDRNLGGAGKVVELEGELVVVSGVYDLMSEAELACTSGQEIVVIEVGSGDDEAFSSVLDHAFARLTALVRLIEDGADRALIDQIVNKCSYELVSILDEVTGSARVQGAVRALKDGMERLTATPCASNARMVLVDSVLALGVF